MKNLPMSLSPELENDESPDSFPGESELAALRGWYAGLSSRESVARYLQAQKGVASENGKNRTLSVH